MTPFEIAVGVLGAVDFGLKVYDQMGAFVSKVKGADNTARDLARKVDILRNTFLAVSEILKRRREQLDGRAPGTDAETNVWVAISKTVESWQETVQQFRETVEKLDTGQAAQRKSWVGKMLWHYKHGHALPVLQGFQNEIFSYNTSLSVLLQCMHGWEQAHEKNNAPAAIEDGVHNLDCAMSEAEKQDSYNSDAATERINRSIALAQVTRDALKGGSKPGRLIDLPEGPENARYNDVRNDVWADIGDDDSGSSDSEVDETFDDKTPRDMAMALIQYYRSNIPFDPEKKETLGSAEYHQRRLLMYAREWNEVYEPPVALSEIETKLAKILSAQGEFDESTRLLKRALAVGHKPLSSRRPSLASSDSAIIRGRASHCYSIAENYLTRYRSGKQQNHLDRAELYAKRSVSLRLELADDPEAISQAVHRLIEIVEYQTHSVEAGVYRSLYLAHQPRKWSVSSTNSSKGYIGKTDFRDVPMALLDQPSISGMTFLIHAIQSGNTSQFEALIEHGVDVEARDLKDRTPLLYAAAKRDHNALDILIKQGANVDALCNEETALHYAIRNCKMGVAACLLDKGAGVDIPSKDGFPPLTLAVHKGKDDIVSLLCKLTPNRRPNLNAQDDNGLTALHHAVRTGSTKILNILLYYKANPDIHSTGEDENTPLHEAVLRNHEASAEILLKYGADVNCKDRNQRTPFLIAVRTKDTKRSLIKLLVDRGAHIDETKFDMGRLPPDLQKYVKKAKSARKRMKTL